MDRPAWLRERREAVVADYDHDAPTYDEDPYSTATHAAFVDRLVSSTPVGGVVLDAPCGTGQYFARISDAGRRVVGIDQSAGMLTQADARGLAERLVRVGLQEMAFEDEFDGAMTVDAMEHMLSLLPIVWLVLGLLEGMGRRDALLAAGIFGLFVLQSVFVVMKTSTPAVAALHPVNGFLILFLAIVLARDFWMLRTATA